MPTYKNTKDHPISWGARTWTPGEEKPVSFFMPNALGLVKISDEPAPAPHVLVSQETTIDAGGSFTMAVPCVERYLLSAIAITGAAKLKISGALVPLDDNADYVGVLEWGKVPQLELSSVSGATVRILVEVA